MIAILQFFGGSPTSLLMLCVTIFLVLTTQFLTLERLCNKFYTIFIENGVGRVFGNLWSHILHAQFIIHQKWNKVKFKEKKFLCPSHNNSDDWILCLWVEVEGKAIAYDYVITQKKHCKILSFAFSFLSSNILNVWKNLIFQKK